MTRRRRTGTAPPTTSDLSAFFATAAAASSPLWMGLARRTVCPGGAVMPPTATHPPQEELEAFALGRLDDAAYDADEAGDATLLAMEYVEGVTLADELRRRGPLPVAEACDAARQAALGLQHASERGLVHRDLKPHNLMRAADGTVKVLDFGLARLLPVTDGATPSDAVLGTPAYMAPEQRRAAGEADSRADVYSPGCTLFFLLTGP